MIPLTTTTTQSYARVRLQGACPSCGIQVPRRVTRVGGRFEETYACPADGTFHYITGDRVGFSTEPSPGAAAERVLAVHTQRSGELHGVPVIA